MAPPLPGRFKPKSPTGAWIAALAYQAQVAAGLVIHFTTAGIIWSRSGFEAGLYSGLLPVVAWIYLAVALWGEKGGWTFYHLLFFGYIAFVLATAGIIMFGCWLPARPSASAQ